MKTKLAGLAAMLFIINLRAQLANNASSVAANPLNTGASVAAIDAAQRYAAAQSEEYRNFLPDYPWRKFNGKPEFIKLTGQEFSGKVVDVSDEGIRVQGTYGKLFGTRFDHNNADNYPDFWVANYPLKVTTGQIIQAGEHQMAWAVKANYTYTTVNGGSRTIDQLEFGIPCDPPAELIAAQQQRLKAEQERTNIRATAAKIKAFTWLLNNATNGTPGIQCSLGQHYLKGDGCESNLTQAIYWFQLAKAGGDMEASNKLEVIQATSPMAGK